MVLQVTGFTDRCLPISEAWNSWLVVVLRAARPLAESEATSQSHLPVSHALRPGEPFPHRLAPNVHVVRGDFEESTTFPESKVIQIGQFRVGLIHGHQVVPWGDPNALAMAQRQLGADILISGHTHRNQVNEFGGRWFINPGSITGAYSPVEADAVPSFILLAVQGAKCVTYVYELHGDQVEVSKSEFSKKSV